MFVVSGGGRRGARAGLLAAGVVAAACGRGPRMQPQYVAAGHAELGPAAIRRYGCGSCHTVPGVREAKGQAGPSLDHYARRTYVAGMLPNTSENLVHWIAKPQEVQPGNAMPNLGVTDREARNIAAYLYTLQ